MNSPTGPESAPASLPPKGNPVPLAPASPPAKSASPSTELFHQLVDVVEDYAIFMLDPDGLVMTWNRGAQKIKGYTAEEIIGRHFSRFYPAEALRANQPEVELEVASQTGQFQEEGWRIRKDGSPFWAYVILTAIRDKNGDLTGFSKVTRDISQHRKDIESLRESEDVFRTAMEHSPIGMALVAPNGKWLKVNSALCNILGYSHEELLATNFQSITHPEDLTADLEHVQELLNHQGDNYEMEKRYFHKNGSTVIASLHVSLIRDALGQPRFFVSQVQDITDRKLAQERIRQQADLLNETRDAIIVTDLADRVTFWNKGAEMMYGWGADEMQGAHLGKTLLKEPESDEAAWKSLLGKGEWSGEQTIHARNGREIITDNRRTLVRDAQGQPKAVLTISTDVTEKKKLEAQIFRTQRMDSLGTLASGIAHDLNNMLSPVTLSTSLLRQQITDAESRQILETVDANMRRAKALVQQVLMFARGVEGERIIVNMRHLLRELRGIVGQTFPKNIRLETVAAKDLWPVKGDSTQLQQVLLNLCVNARDAMPNGGTVTVKLENIVLDANYVAMNPEASTGGFVVLSVIDNGIGMPPQVVDKIFEPFFSTKEVGKGTGLGLSTALAIVKSHRGFINVYSEEGKGSRFRVYLPAESTPETERIEKQQTQFPRGNGELILLVDDEAAIIDLCKAALERYGYRAITAVNGAEAVARYAQQRDEIKVVLIDMMMPIMDGPTAIVALKSINPKVIIVAASGLPHNLGLAKAADSGVKFFLSKPYTAESLMKILHDALLPAPPAT